MYPVAPADSTRSIAGSARYAEMRSRPMAGYGDPSRQPKPAAGELVIDRLLPRRR
ncbi:hypothetical protein [Nocardia sp. NBC_00416]|uniref:hypothetical protein n=1 Tax=Nocardia sp. NBC_00416 TaxID=2975991 RepID=UPI002E1DFB66